MRAKHILLEKAFVYKKGQEKLLDENYVYDNSLGYWVKKDNGKPAVYDPEFSGPKTKKEDIETGEDQKGE
jgi:hypothetical protein